MLKDIGSIYLNMFKFNLHLYDVAINHVPEDTRVFNSTLNGIINSSASIYDRVLSMKNKINRGISNVWD